MIPISSIKSFENTLIVDSYTGFQFQIWQTTSDAPGGFLPYEICCFCMLSGKAGEHYPDCEESTMMVLQGC